MRRRRLVLVGAVVAGAAALPTGSGSAETQAPRYMAFGGGQYPVDARGEGNTLAFNARQTEPGGPVAEGEVQDFDRTTGLATVTNGRVLCMVVSPDGKRASIDFRSRRDPPEGNTFHRLYIEDNGQGASDDIVLVQRNLLSTEVTRCSLGATPPTGGILARGNVQIDEVG